VSVEVETRQIEVPGWPRAHTPLIELRGRPEGPTVSLLAGVGGASYPGIEACWRIIERLRDTPINGTLRVIPMADIAAFLDRSEHLCPLDGRPLATALAAGTIKADDSATGAIARAIAGALAGSDFHIELRGGDHTEVHAHWVVDVPPADTPTVTAGHVAGACGADFRVVFDRAGQWPLRPATAGIMAARGVPSLLLSTGGLGHEFDGDADTLVADVLRVMQALDIVETIDAPDAVTPRLVGPRIWSHAVARSALWVPDVTAGSPVASGDPLGQVWDYFGNPIEDVAAPFDGVVLAITTSMAVSAPPLVNGDSWPGRTVTLAESTTPDRSSDD
jgi:predicted deacylase